ncbi:GSCOCG00006979001-RA-CDS [Cotesia congregata]|uniref:Similar to Histone H1-III (Glyptotendipes barbipes) n=1 Tax=Cotesia congregata TaxID=51543 RepID=A0A8J2HDR2_COTCN|nr:GSCOCG00006979001-RA-CDS [Cotesia congregata]CAG5092702.1 Similar to Histone H1-III (Glyptotendipes barbipes) [Cotesia congregata]
MTDTEVISSPVEDKAVAKVDSLKKTVAKTDSPKKAPKAKKPSTKPAHPSTAEMVTAAVKALAERNGSSLQAIKKYVAANYKLDVDKQAPFIKKFLKAAVTKGTLVQTKGKGASGSFKLPVAKAAAKSKPKAASGEKKTAAVKKAPVKKPAAKKVSEAKVSVKKITSPKKAATKKPASPKKAKAPAKPKVSASPKAKKATKAPTAKPKAPKPKKAAASKVARSPAKKVSVRK